MPIYEYKCRNCNKVFERFSILGKKNITQMCPHCNGVGDKIISISNFNMQHWREKLKKELDYALTPESDME